MFVVAHDALDTLREVQEDQVVEDHRRIPVAKSGASKELPSKAGK